MYEGATCLVVDRSGSREFRGGRSLPKGWQDWRWRVMDGRVRGFGGDGAPALRKDGHSAASISPLLCLIFSSAPRDETHYSLRNMSPSQITAAFTS
ncbi:hypothetical protein P4O66_022262 [Electrophorus voltai]|uniref:Uncharacterized protein n=1 Tax=Electrophorus voltai TaxID=2609070 RepID=A0AAD9E1Q0_9TELE|nr:hypothetical protein P4O66_022262 [Electrophorus voltai]